MKGDRKRRKEGKEFFFSFFGTYRLLNLSDKEPCFRGGALEAG